MKLITRFELASCRTEELHALYRNTFNALCRCRPHSRAANLSCIVAKSRRRDSVTDALNVSLTEMLI
jgi:hypothetical protein